MQVRSLGILVLLSLLVLAFGCGREPAEPAVDDAAPAAETQADAPAADAPPADVVPAEDSTPAEASAAAGDQETAPPAVDAAASDAVDVELVATVNGRPIYADALAAAKAALISQYQQLYAQFGMDIRAMLVGAEGRIFDLGLESEAVDRAVFGEIMEAEYERRELDVTEDEVDAEFDRQYALLLDSQGLTEEMLIEYLDSQGIEFDAFKENGRANIGVQLKMEAVQRAVSEPIELSEEDLLAYFETNRDAYNTPEQVRASHILVRTEDEALAALARLEAGEDFAAVAIEVSEDPGSAAAGGDLGWFGRGQMVGEFEDAAFGLEVGEMSGIVGSDYGYHIILLTDHRDANEPTYEEVADQVLADAEQEIIDERFRAWYEQAYTEAVIAVELPLVAAHRAQLEDLAAGLAAFLAIKDEGTIDEPYLDYIIGSIYEDQMDELAMERDELEASPSEDPTLAEDIADLNARIDELRALALAAYQEARAQFPDDLEIAAKVQAMQPVEPEADAGGDAEPDADTAADAGAGDETP